MIGIVHNYKMKFKNKYNLNRFSKKRLFKQQNANMKSENGNN